MFTFGNAHFYGSLGGRKVSSPIVGLIPTPSYQGYWLVDGNGVTYPFGDASRRRTVDPARTERRVN